MTVTYTNEVANARLGGFSRLLVRWRGSVYKLIYKELLIYITLYGAISLVYRFALHGDNKRYFEKLCLQFQHYTDLVPVSFVLGFYVTIVVGRWWSQLENLPWPDRIMMIVVANVHGADERGRLIRRTLLRYLNLAEVLTYRLVSRAVFKRFPTVDHVVKAGLMTPNEHQQYESMKTDQIKYWIPIMWFSNLLTKIRQEGRIYDDMTFKLLLEELNRYRGFCGWLVNYDWISVPLVYTQVVTIAVYMFFMSTLLSRQYLDVDDHPGHEVDLYIPIFTIGQFFFYMGWLKVAEQLINPFGEDDDDFEANWCIDRNHEIAMKVADQMYAKLPKLEKDRFWNASNADIPYTAAAANHKVEPYMGSTFDMRVDKDEMLLIQDFNSNYLAPVTEQSNHSAESNNQKGTFKSKAADVTTLMTSNRFLAQFRSGPQKLDKAKLLETEHKNVQSIGVLHSPTSGSQPGETTNQNSDDDSVTSLADDDDVDDDAVEGGDEQERDELLLERSGEQERRKRSSEIVQEQTRAHKSPKKKDCVTSQTVKRAFPPGKLIVRSESDEDEGRRNAEERTYLSNRKRRSRGLLPPRKRRMFKPENKLLALRHQRRLRKESMAPASPDTTSLFSETDLGSGTNMSPFGSNLSFATSIPSPKPLRWAYRTKARHLYADSNSITLSMPSPSGGETTDVPTTPVVLSPLHPEDLSERVRADLGPRGGTWGPGTDHNDVIPTMPFTDDLRRRLQVVRSSSPSVQRTSPAPNDLLMIAPDVTPETRWGDFRSEEETSKKRTCSSDERSDGSKMQGGLWNAIKLWKQKRKMRKLLAVASESDVKRLCDVRHDVITHGSDPEDGGGLVMTFSRSGQGRGDVTWESEGIPRMAERPTCLFVKPPPKSEAKVTPGKGGDVTYDVYPLASDVNNNEPAKLGVSPAGTDDGAKSCRLSCEIELEEIAENVSDEQNSTKPLIEFEGDSPTREGERSSEEGEERDFPGLEELRPDDSGEIYRKHKAVLNLHYLDSIAEKVSDDESAVVKSHEGALVGEGGGGMGVVGLG